jgi:hypothetical protein
MATRKYQAGGGYTNTTQGEIAKPTMKRGGAKKKYQLGGTTEPTPVGPATSTKKTRFEKRQEKKIVKAQTRSKIAEIEGEGTVSQKRNNRADRASKVLGTARVKTPKSVSTSTSTSTSTTDNRNSGNTSNTTNSGSSSGSNSGATGGQGGAGGRSGSSSGVDNSRKSSTSVSQSQNNSRTTNNTSNTNVRQSQNNSRNSSKTINQSQDNSTKTNVNNSRKNTQIGAGNSSNNNRNKQKGGAVKKYKTGGMVNSNAKIYADKTAGSRGVKSGVNAKVSKQTSAKGRVGGTNKSVPRPVKR